jgi:putative ABC transport system ATP-binding protein
MSRHPRAGDAPRPRRTPLVRRRTREAPPDGQTPPVIQLDDVHRIYRLGQISVPALRGVSLTVQRGDFVAIMGSSGSGKSTLMNILGCLDVPTHGRYRLDGIDVRNFDEDDLADVRNRKLGFVFQSYNLVARTAALANVELPLAYAGLPRAERRRRALAALDAVGMADRVHHLPSELSGGQQQRVAVARALVTHPALMLADEPTGNLDSHSTADILSVFDELNRQGHTIVLITHEPDVAARAKRIVQLADGLLVEDRRVAGVYGPPPALSAGATSGASA